MTIRTGITGQNLVHRVRLVVARRWRAAEVPAAVRACSPLAQIVRVHHTTRKQRGRAHEDETDAGHRGGAHGDPRAGRARPGRRAS